MKHISKLLAAPLLGAVLAPAIAAEAPDLAAHAAQTYLERAKFPEWSQPVAGTVDPVASGRLPTQQRLSAPEAPSAVVWASSISAEAGETIDLFASLDWMGADASLDTLAGLRNNQMTGWTFTASLVQGSVGEIATVTYADDGKGADAVAGDGIHSARFTLPAATAPATGTAQNVMVTVTAANQAGDVRKAVGGFLYSSPGAYLTGNYRQAVQDGNLVVQAEVDVLTAGRYHIAGTLTDLAGTALATAQNAKQLDAGKQWLDLAYYGLIFHQLGGAGPMQLGSVTLTTANGMPNALGKVERDAFTLSPVALTQLTAKPFAR